LRLPSQSAEISKINPESQQQWGIVTALEGGIMGVYSVSDAKSIKTADFGYTDRDFGGETNLSVWKFVYTPQTSPTR
jgi:hypothetical protein